MFLISKLWWFSSKEPKFLHPFLRSLSFLTITSLAETSNAFSFSARSWSGGALSDTGVSADVWTLSALRVIWLWLRFWTVFPFLHPDKTCFLRHPWYWNSSRFVCTVKSLVPHPYSASAAGSLWFDAMVVRNWSQDTWHQVPTLPVLWGSGYTQFKSSSLQYVVVSYWLGVNEQKLSTLG